MTTKKNKLNTPKAQLSIPVLALQQLLWIGREYPQYFHSFKSSPELMKIYKILVDRPSVWESSVKYELSPDEKLHLVFGTDYRCIYTYKVIEDFILNIGELKGKEEILNIDLIKKARQLKKGDTVLIRKDTRDEDLKIDLQILTKGLFQDFSEDWKVFSLDTVDFKHIRPFLKLVDSDGMDE